ncbi:MAG: 6-carboxytetrahydropterin synthase [Sedimentisphaerales bacterium]|nr:6-carboxytetrahydropterin synthase [Sedimentisphaerales bacterium]
MYKLTRQVRFSVNPFLVEDSRGYNSYASKPAGEGLSIFLELSVEVTGSIDPATGFVVNVSEIDGNVREFAVPIFAGRIKKNFQAAKHTGLPEIAELLVSVWNRLTDKFETAKLNELSLKLNPFRKIVVNSKDLTMVYFSEKFEFAAMHKLWNDDFSEQHNMEVFGKCANPTGHGHNYVVEVTIQMPTVRNDFRIGDFEKIVDDEFIKLLDHKNLNADVEKFNKTNPTVENIVSLAWNQLIGKFGQAKLHRVTVWETDKTYCSYED